MFVKMHYFTSMYVYSIVCRILYHKMKQFLYSSSIFSVYCNANFLNNGGKNNNIYIYFFHPELCQFLKMVIFKLYLINIIRYAFNCEMKKEIINQLFLAIFHCEKLLFLFATWNSEDYNWMLISSKQSFTKSQWNGG